MTTQAHDRRTTGQPGGGGRNGVYVYGILPGDIEVEPGATGVGDPPGEIRAVRHEHLAALVSDVNLDRPLGQPEDLMAHQTLLDDVCAAEVPVLPLRFGAVLSSDDAVADELLGAHYDEFTTALDQLAGHAEYVVHGRYVERAVLNEVVEADPRAARLLEQIKDADPDATRDLRIELGEIVGNAIEAKRAEDTRALGEELAGQATASVVRPPTNEFDAVYAAFLVETATAEQFSQTIERLTREWRERIGLRLMGPLAAYDFVGATAPAAES